MSASEHDAYEAAAAARSPERALALKLWIALARAHNAVEAHARDDVDRHGLTLAEFAVLEVLFHKGPLLLGDVRRKVLVSSGGTTYLVNRLVERGLVERRECEDDRRACYAALTREGAALVARVFPEHAARIERALSGLNTREKQRALRLLRTLGMAAARSFSTD